VFEYYENTHLKNQRLGAMAVSVDGLQAGANLSRCGFELLFLLFETLDNRYGITLMYPRWCGLLRGRGLRLCLAG